MCNTPLHSKASPGPHGTFPPPSLPRCCRCIIDRQPRKFDAESCNVLANLAEMVTREIERDSVAERSRESEQMKLLRNLNAVK
jgi:hypothetical protein